MLTLEKKNKVEAYIQEQLQHRESGDPICAYVYDLERLKTHAKGIKESLPASCRLYYAVKANPDRRLLEVLEPVIDGFEVASYGEISNVGEVSDKPMLFGGPGKKDREIRTALQTNVEYLNVESFHELNRMMHIAEQLSVTIPVLLRVNLSKNVSDSHIRMSGVPTQFGVDERDIPGLITHALQSDYIDIKGFHFHAMSNNLDAKSHVKFVGMCIEKSLSWKKQFALDASIVNVGGGIGINYWNPEEPFEWNILADGLADYHETYQEQDLTLFLEIGRYMVAGCGSYVSEVLDVKTNHDEHFAVIRGGSHHLRMPAAWKISHPFNVFSVEEWHYPFVRPEVIDAKLTIAGELCTPNDVLVRKEHVDRLRAGDIVIFQYAGAYGWTISHHDFLSHPHPEIVFI
ncbi:type III PLP-dependent enzyme [Pseudalkalibacillus berkeleyi]|uniref:Type III PLP-dependent enzyme n=1 Tax=Pseudalkalibacillus berkeleyi TaxID=1069813 RepID=A0ABS9GXP3_9BACL|nr:type III PLP-dependent enzyme [Pseudalkalibacillus berkeleyi]MCF6136431.1 type III PLP-dependent enzyme [Pseudalkalibacillus berkeleyi]